MASTLWKLKINCLVLAFFLIYFFVGLGIFENYGVSIDEPLCQTRGILALNYVTRGDLAIFASASEISHSQFLEMAQVVLGKIFVPDGDSRAVYLLRHLVNFILFYLGVVFFYGLCQERFHNWKISLLGSFFLIFSPRIFANSFYNSKDIPFLVLSIICVYTLVNFIKKKTVPRALVHGLTTALAIDLRLSGVMFFFLTGLFLIENTFRDQANRRKTLKLGVVYGLATCLFIILFWPTLWRNPLHYFIFSWITMAHYTGGPLYEFYLGQVYNLNRLPWHYLLVWILITTPLSYSFFFAAGVLAGIKKYLAATGELLINDLIDLICFFWFLTPILAVIIFKIFIYNTWRQLFFIYPAFLMIALMGLVSFFQFLKMRLSKKIFRVTAGLVILAVVVDLIGVGRFMIKNHPHQYLYFNRLAGRNLEEIKKYFPLDYWSVSSRELLEYIVKTDPASFIKIGKSWSMEVNQTILPLKDRQRISFVMSPNQAKYMLDDYLWHGTLFPSKVEYYSVKIDGYKVSTVYKLR